MGTEMSDGGVRESNPDSFTKDYKIYPILYFCSQMNEFWVFLTNCDAGNQCPIKAIRANRQKNMRRF